MQRHRGSALLLATFELMFTQVFHSAYFRLKKQDPHPQNYRLKMKYMTKYETNTVTFNTSFNSIYGHQYIVQSISAQMLIFSREEILGGQ